MGVKLFPADVFQRGGSRAHGPSGSALAEGRGAGGAAGCGEDQSPGPGGPLPRRGRPAARLRAATAAGQTGSTGTSADGTMDDK